MTETSVQTSSTPSFLFENVNKILSTFIPGHIHRRFDQVSMMMDKYVYRGFISLS